MCSFRTQLQWVKIKKVCFIVIDDIIAVLFIWKKIKKIYLIVKFTRRFPQSIKNYLRYLQFIFVEFGLLFYVAAPRQTIFG